MMLSNAVSELASSSVPVQYKRATYPPVCMYPSIFSSMNNPEFLAKSTSV